VALIDRAGRPLAEAARVFYCAIRRVLSWSRSINPCLKSMNAAWP